MASEQAERRESEFLATTVDPLAQEVLDAAEPSDAYHAAIAILGALLDALDWLPHGGAVYAAWADLTDLFETGKTPIADAHAALQTAGIAWLSRAGDVSTSSIEAWLEQARKTADQLVPRDGTFWDQGE